MARLHEYQTKRLLRQAGILTPAGSAVSTAAEAFAFADEIGTAVVVKAQVWTTSRAAQNLIRFAATPEQARAAAADLLGSAHGKFTVEQVLVEEQISIAQQYYIGLTIDSALRAPVLLLSLAGGSGIEERATLGQTVASLPVAIMAGVDHALALALCQQAGVPAAQREALADVIVRFYGVARSYEARSAEINPLALTTDGRLVALDARLTVDDYAVFRHPDLEIEIAREFDHPPTRLERIAWEVEKNDYRGTFYFVQVRQDFEKGSGVIGFHGNGGGGSMITMDALTARGFQVADFVDTSGNPPASKVYRAARIILSQPNIDGYFAGGSGVASQEQFHSARGLVKAFIDTALNVPAVIRIGGNGEERAIEILQRANGAFPAPLEAYGRDTTQDQCAQRLKTLIDGYTPAENPQPPLREPAQEPYTFQTVTNGTITFDHAVCRDCESKACVQTCAPQILSLQDGVPVLNITPAEAKRGGCTECLACEVECWFLGRRGAVIQLPIAGLEG
jgi:succinyl-CoA synthetase beta subunit